MPCVLHHVANSVAYSGDFHELSERKKFQRRGTFIDAIFRMKCEDLQESWMSASLMSRIRYAGPSTARRT